MGNVGHKVGNRINRESREILEHARKSFRVFRVFRDQRNFGAFTLGHNSGGGVILAASGEEENSCYRSGRENFMRNTKAKNTICLWFNKDA
jgi:hypothetical protein